MLKSRRYCNLRLGDFLKELDLTENRFESVKKNDEIYSETN